MNATTSRKPRQRKPLAPVCGKVRVLQPVGTVGPVENQTGEIEINGKPYFVRVCSGCFQLFGFDAKRQESTHYDIAPDCSTCDCPDATFQADRPEGCKHRKAVKALVAAGKLPALDAGTIEDKAARADADDVHQDDEADYLAGEWADAEAEAFHSQYDAA